jgi:LysR family transcriptional regulator, hydrogen peroxide-inducible genes activator
MNSISLTQLEYIVEVARKKSFGLAARSCFVTQPTISMQISKLEEELGVILFDRSKKPVEPTPMGHKIIQQARVALQEVSRIEELIHTEKGEIEGELKLGVIPTLAPYLLPLFLETFVKKYPKVDLIIEELQTQPIVDKLKEDSLDAGILVTPLNIKGIMEKHLFYETFIVYLTAQHPLHKLTEVSEKDLSLNDIWLLNEGHCFREQAMDLCKKKKGAGSEKNNLVFESGNLETLKRLVDKKFGYTLLPYMATMDIPPKDAKKKLRFFKPPAPTREVSIVTSRSFLKKSIIEALSENIIASLPEELKQKPSRSRVMSLTSFK